jgi:4-amino-4-deoxy-L-arabinose transferase-like glycosyltransferase
VALLIHADSYNRLVKSKAASTALVMLLVLALAVPRILGINRFATIDEPYWLTAGSDFYYALGQRDFGSTVYDYHPAVTTMWIIAAAMLLYFPGYRGLGQGYFDVYKDSLDRFLLAHSHSSLGLLTDARLLQTVVIVFLLLSIFWFLWRLLGWQMAAASVLLVSFDPFFLGHSRLLNHEGLLSLLVVISLLALVSHLFYERQRLFLVISGVAAGLAQLTKSSSIAVLPLILLLFTSGLLFGTFASLRPRLRALLIDLGIWLVLLALVYVLLWPGMWVDPARMLYEVYGNAFSYAFEGARIGAAGAASTVPVQPHFQDIVYYVQSILWRTTPIVWIGAVLALLALLRESWGGRIALTTVLLAGALFVVLFGVASGRNSAHYVLTTYVALDILAAAGLLHSATWLAGRLRGLIGRALPGLILGGAVVLQAASALAFYPYYYTYFNPVLEAQQPGIQDPNFGYGEGLDLAAAYLRQKPESSESTAMAFYGRGPFSFFYPGTTEPLKTVYADAENVPQLQQTLGRSDYLVIYYALENGRNSPANLMRALRDAVPEKSIWMNGIEYIRIYAVRSFPAGFYDSLAP